MALGFMRRHRRVALRFLWLGDRRLHHPVHPAFDGRRTSGARARRWSRWARCPSRSASTRRRTCASARCTRACTRGGSTTRCSSAWASRSRRCRRLIDDRVLQLEARAARHLRGRRGGPQRLATAPEFQVDGQLHGRGELRRRLELQGITVGEFEQELRAPHPARARGLPSSPTACMVSPRGGGGGVPPPQRAGQGRIRAGRRRDVAARSRVDRRRGAGALRRPSKDRYALPRAARRQLPAARPAEAAAAGHRHRRARSEAYYDAHQDEFKQAEQVCASHILVKVKATPEATEGHPDARRATLAQAALDQVKAGADFAAVAKQGVRGPGLGAAGRRPRLLRARAHGAGVRERGLRARPRARPRTW